MLYNQSKTAPFSDKLVRNLTCFPHIFVVSHLCSALTIALVCFGLQESEGGLYVCMNTFLGFGREHVERHYRKTGQSIYMHLKRHVREVGLATALHLLQDGRSTV